MDRPRRLDFANSVTTAQDVLTGGAESGPKRMTFPERVERSGPFRMTFPEKTVTEDGKPRKMSFPQAAEEPEKGPRRMDIVAAPKPPPEPARVPKRLEITPAPKPPSVVQEPSRVPKRLDIPEPPRRPTAPPPAPVNRVSYAMQNGKIRPPRPIDRSGYGAPRPRTFTPATPHVQSPPPPPPPPPPVSGDKKLEAKIGAIKTPEEARYERLLVRARDLNPEAGNDRNFPATLRNLLDLNPDDWFNWGQRSLDDNRTATTGFAEINRELTFLDVTKWIDDTKEAACKPAGMFDWTRKPPAYYEAKLIQIRDSLARLIPGVDAEVNKLEPMHKRMMLDTIALQVAAETLKKPVQMQIADNRLRVLMSAHQAVFVTLTGLENAKVSMVQNLQTIDVLLNQTIPQWQVAQSHIK